MLQVMLAGYKKDKESTQLKSRFMSFNIYVTLLKIYILFCKLYLFSLLE